MVIASSVIRLRKKGACQLMPKWITAPWRDDEEHEKGADMRSKRIFSLACTTLLAGGLLAGSIGLAAAQGRPIDGWDGTSVYGAGYAVQSRCTADHGPGHSGQRDGTATHGPGHATSNDGNATHGPGHSKQRDCAAGHGSGHATQRNHDDADHANADRSDWGAGHHT
jgi:hypothetical protein